MLMSCAKERTVTKSQVVKGLFGRDAEFSPGTDDSGNPQMQSDKRSSFENTGANSMASGNNYSGKEYTKKSYRKERWGGDSDYKTKLFNGSKTASNYDKEPWFVKNQSSDYNQRANEGKKSFFTKLFGTSSAREQNGESLDRPSDAETDVRNRVFKQPEVIGWKDQQTLSISDTKSMLGR